MWCEFCREENMIIRPSPLHPPAANAFPCSHVYAVHVIFSSYPYLPAETRSGPRARHLRRRQERTRLHGNISSAKNIITYDVTLN